jgi:hypothetical protein
VIAKEQLLWKQHGRETLVLIPLDLDGCLFAEEWNRGWKNQIVSRLAADFTGWEKRLAVDAAETSEDRMKALGELGDGVFRRQNAALESVRRALFLGPEIPDQ